MLEDSGSGLPRLAARARHLQASERLAVAADDTDKGVCITIVHGAPLPHRVLSAHQAGWALSSLPASELCDGLASSGTARELVMHCLASFGSSVKGQQAADGGGAEPSELSEDDCDLWMLDEAKVCCHYAGKLLARGKQMSVSELTQALREAVPCDVLRPSVEMLKGEVLVTGKGPSAVVKAYSVKKLPKDPAKRFAALFAERPKWEAADMDPFIADLKASNMYILVSLH